MKRPWHNLAISARLLTLLIASNVFSPASANAQMGRIGVFELHSGDVPDHLVQAALDALATTLGQLDVGEIVTTQEINTVLDAQRRAELAGCDSSECFIELGALIGVGSVVTGRISSIDGTLVVSLQHVDVQEGRTLNRVTLEWGGRRDAITEVLGAAGELLMIPAPKRKGGILRLENVPRGAMIRVGQVEMSESAMTLDTGIYALRVDAPGYAPYATQVLIRSGLTTVVPLELRAPHTHRKPVGIGLAGGAYVPVAKGYVSERTGLSLDAFFWGVLEPLVIVPRGGVRFDIADRNAQSYMEVAFDIGVYWLPFSTAVTPFLALGGGGRWLRTERPRTVVVGQIIQTTQQQIVLNADFGVGGYGRIGMLMLQHGSKHTLVGVEYNVSRIAGVTPQGVQIFLGFVL